MTARPDRPTTETLFREILDHYTGALSDIEDYRNVVERLVNVIDAYDDNSEGRFLSAIQNFHCRECTAGTSHKNIPCAYHTAKAMLKVQP